MWDFEQRYPAESTEEAEAFVDARDTIEHNNWWWRKHGSALENFYAANALGAVAFRGVEAPVMQMELLREQMHRNSQDRVIKQVLY